MNVKINPEIWNTLTPVQKRALAESVHTLPASRRWDLAELAAWGTTLAATFSVVCFATLLLR
jgi:hypothetical protein